MKKQRKEIDMYDFGGSNEVYSENVNVVKLY